MAVSGGPHTVTRALSYGYDTGYGVANNSTSTIHYPGEPAENLIALASDAEIERSGTSYPYYSANITSYIQSRWTPTNNRLVQSFEGRRDFSQGGTGSGGDGYPRMYIYFTDWSWSSSFGVTTYDWGYAAQSVTMPDPTGKTVYFSIYHMNSGNPGRSYSRKHMISFGTRAVPFVNGTRSNTQSLLDLAGNNTITLASGTFNADGTPAFDGTDDYITAPGFQYTTAQPWTADMVVNPSNAADTSWNAIFGGGLGSGGYWMFHSNRLTYYEGVFGGSTKILYSSRYIGTHFPQDTHKHLSIRYNANSTFDIFVNGEKFNFSYTFGGSYSLKLDRVGAASSRYGSVKIPVFKFHNVALTDQEIQQNYLSYKNRFSL